ncbi:minichromosome maintenance protein MCM [Haloarcula amylovorans]|uniref:minichromosome maintenance protein MCM n=1 Tax=Haloarcula amylovorans TaxID=2562280 RepID=UPI001075EE79|nr:minichromosome maintenance protein MCM [Halomicroarcula amylolytica]
MATAENTELIDYFEEFYRNYYRNDIGELAQHYPNDQKSLYVDWQDLYRFDSDLAEDYQTKPEQLQEYAEEALRLYDLPVDISLGQAHVRITNLPETTGIRELRHEHHGCLVEIQGTVGEATEVRPKILTAAFECQRCGTLTRIPQASGKFQEPHECQGCERQGPFRLNTSQSEFIDAQKIRLQENHAALKNGQEPQHLEVNIEDDITGQVTAGDRIRVTGVIKLNQRGSSRQKSPSFDLYMDGVSIDTNVESYPELTISEADKKRILELSATENIYQQFIDSIASSVYGSETIKLAIILQLFSGIQKELPDGSQSRGNIHTLIVSPTGTGVERLVSQGSRLAPRGLQVSGTDTTAAGLTAAATTSSDAAGDDPWTLKAGATVMADKGLLALTNLESLSHEAATALGSTLESQCVDVSKASQTESLRAEAAVLAAATPRMGHIEDMSTIGRQLDLPPQLLSNFDLVFTCSEPGDDDAVADHVLEVNRATEGRIGLEEGSQPEPISESASFPAPDAFTPPIEASLIRKYVVYARTACFPAISEKAKDTLKEFYVSARAQSDDVEGAAPVNMQKIESLIRLTEASARVRLADMATQADAERAIEVVQASLVDLGTLTETKADAATKEIPEETSADLSDPKTIKSEVISVLEDKHSGGAPHEKVVDQGERYGFSEPEVEVLIEKLQQMGEIYEGRTDRYRTT